MMKGLILFIVLSFLIIPNCLVAQQDSIRLACPLENATVVPPPKNVMTFDPPDLCIVLASEPDTVVKSCITGTVTNVEASADEPGKWDVVLFCKFRGKDYYFWYSGLAKTTVRRNDNLKIGQPIGNIEKGGRIELLMYDFETQVDPTRYLDCKRILKN